MGGKGAKKKRETKTQVDLIQKLVLLTTKL